MYILQYNQNESKPGEAKASDPELRNIFPTLWLVWPAPPPAVAPQLAPHFPHPGSQFLSLCDLHNNTENTATPNTSRTYKYWEQNKKAQE